MNQNIHFTRKVIIWTIIIVCFVTTIIIPTIFFIENKIHGVNNPVNVTLLNILFTLFVSISITTANVFTFRFFNDRYINYKGYLKIFVIEILVTSINAIVIMAIALYYFFYFTDNKLPKNDEFFSSLFTNVVIAVIVNIIVCGFAEAYILFIKWKNTLIETEKLQREKAESQYAALKNQVNPHFLFNSLNSLSSLIRVSPEKAIDFVDKFSKIYRYVLDMNDKMVVELKDELNFLQSFYFLQKIRFGKNLEIETNIDAAKLNEYIPPLSIQILIENAIKHNEISSEKPLKINIYLENDFLVIENNLQLKNSMESSTGIGLSNLKERYEHLSDKKPEFYATNTAYIAKIPLLSAT